MSHTSPTLSVPTSPCLPNKIFSYHEKWPLTSLHPPLPLTVPAAADRNADSWVWRHLCVKKSDFYILPTCRPRQTQGSARVALYSQTNENTFMSYLNSTRRIIPMALEICVWAYLKYLLCLSTPLTPFPIIICT
jgi:hypothetical protein